jgi:putative acetyltransferase
MGAISIKAHTMTPSLRPFLPDDAELLAILMQASVEELAVDDYSEAQRAAWCALAEERDEFAMQLARALTLVALDEDAEPVGFASLSGNRTLVHVYVHPDLTTLGIGRVLVEALMKLSLARGGEAMVADVTDNARPFFEKLGFTGTARQTLNYADEWLGATRMEKALRAPKDETLQ